MGTQLSWKKRVLVVCKILGLFVNILTADDMYCLLNRGNLWQDLQKQLSQKQKIFSEFFFAFSKFRFNFEDFQEKKWPSWLMCFWTDGLRKTCLDKRLKSPIEEDPSTSNMVNRPKHYWNLNDRSVTIFIYHCEGNSVGKTLSWWYGKY